MSFDTAVIGAGLAGSFAAIKLASAGQKVILFERERGPHHKVCGEFLSGEAVACFDNVGLNLRALGGVAIDSVRLHGPKRSGACRLPFSAIGLSRKFMDEALLLKAEAVGVTVQRGHLIKEVPPDFSFGPGIQVHSVIVASGKHEMRGLARSGPSEFVGYKMHLRLNEKERRHVELFLYRGGYGGLSPIEDGLTNFCFLLEKSLAKEVGLDWRKIAARLSVENLGLAERLAGAQPMLERPITVAPIPYGYQRVDSGSENLYFVGDQCAVIPSLAGEGMAMACASGIAAAEAILSGESAVAFQKQMSAQFAGRIHLGMWIHRLFKLPRVFDWMGPLVSVYPQPVEQIFLRTRSGTWNTKSQ